ncbi:unnamed protein product [marine sediment metagenome]|uniref:N-acetyltransferase domain-containing protein n=1 Tax=marine sediment metagenome TaxID=412755 RepID=X0RIQ2_9ZZZZ
MKLNARKLINTDYKVLVDWWKWWRWPSIPKNFLPDNGTGGIMIQKENIPIVAGFIYYTNSDAVFVEWIISNPKYKDNDRKEAIEMLLNTIEAICKEQGKKYMFSIGRNQSLINTHKKLGWDVDNKPSYEIAKKI